MVETRQRGPQDHLPLTPFALRWQTASPRTLTTRFLSVLFFGVASSDPATYRVVCLSLLVMALLACLVPASQAVRCEPAAVLQRVADRV